jgi:DNA-binding LacI/PurR family transcriptional regulator
MAPDAAAARMTPRQQRVPGDYVTRRRLAGYRAALEAAGIDWKTVPVYGYPGGLSGAEAGYRMAPYLLDRPERPSAILAMSDELALGLLRAARERDIDVPGELSVVGFDDLAGAARSRPPLTTVHQSLAEKGAVTARLLLDAGCAGNRRITLPVHLVVRCSTAPAVGRP